MHELPAAKAALPRVFPLLEDPQPEVQMVACAAVAAMADKGDRAAAQAVAGRLEADREIQWNAAMTLARLGDGRGRLTLMNMLDRQYWQGLELEYSEGATTVRRRFSPAEVDNNLRSAIQAARHLDDRELAGLIGRLCEDPSVSVREEARAAMNAAKSSSARPAPFATAGEVS
jgi:HEAT repeat protein